MFEETLYQSSADGTPFVDILKKQGIVPGIKVDTGLAVSAAETQSVRSQQDPRLCVCVEQLDGQM